MIESEFKTVELSIDSMGKILFLDNRVFRAINDEYVEQVRNMLSNGFLKELITEGLFPDTWETDVDVEGYSFVVEHQTIEHWNYPYEWSFDMLKDAALLVLKVNDIANKYGYEVMDGHASNVVFNINKPLYIDLGSFIEQVEGGEGCWRSYRSFYKSFYMPLYLWSKGFPDIAQNIFLMMDYFDEKEFLKIKHPFVNLVGNGRLFDVYEKLKILTLVSDAKIKSKLKNKYKISVALVIKRMLKNGFNVEIIRKEMSDLHKPVESSMWNSYHNDVSVETDERFIRITKFINSLEDAHSVLELGSNQGKFAAHIIKSTKIDTVIATDYDSEAVNIMYSNNKALNILPLLFDMVRTNGRKYDDYVYGRLKSDVVVALAVTHHLILTQCVPIDYIFNVMKKLTNKYIVVEFMPLGLYAGDVNNIPKLPGFYNINWFRENFIKCFDLITDEELEINRHVFLGKLKDN